MNYKHLTTEELINYFKSQNMTRHINKLHVHHTWSPNHDDFNRRGADSIQMGMYNYHVYTLGWSDIGQHLTLFPDGTWGVGRDFNITPASIKGYNTGGFAIEMVGNFDVGFDRFEKDQAESMYIFSAFFLENMDLKLEDILFHNEKSEKTCPGTSIVKSEFVKDVKFEMNKNNVSNWAKDAQKWVIENDISDGSRPKDVVTREELWQMLYNYEKMKGDLNGNDD